MPRPKTIKNATVSAMKALDTYKMEFEPIVDIYVGLREQYDLLMNKFIDSGYRYDEITVQGTKKAPIVTTLEALRKDILSYASQLGLTAHGLLKINEKAFSDSRPMSKLDAFMAEDEKDE